MALVAKNAVRGDNASYPLLDWLRFALASVVALVHSGIAMPGWAGNFAVQIFFAMSGWLIGGILLRTQPSGMPHFFFNRATRIWIPYFLSVFVLYSLAYLRQGWGPHFSEFLIYDVTFTHNWWIEKVSAVVATMPLQGTGAGFWSISVEEQFYLAAPLALVFTPYGKSPVLWFGIAAWACLSGWWYGSVCMGVLAAAVSYKYPGWHTSVFARIAFTVTIALFLVAINLDASAYRWGASLCAVSIILLSAINGQRTTLGTFVGGISFPLYLYQWVGVFTINLIVKVVHADLPAKGLWSYALAVVAASVAYIAIDRPVAQRKQAYFTNARGWAIGVAAYGLLFAGIIFGLLWSGASHLQ